MCTWLVSLDILYDLWRMEYLLLLLIQLKDPSVDVALPRTTGKDMVTYIEGELVAAIESKRTKDNYQKGDNEYGRFTNGLAYTVLMKLYMHEKEWAKPKQ